MWPEIGPSENLCSTNLHRNDFSCLECIKTETTRIIKGQYFKLPASVNLLKLEIQTYDSRTLKLKAVVLYKLNYEIIQTSIGSWEPFEIFSKCRWDWFKNIYQGRRKRSGTHSHVVWRNSKSQSNFVHDLFPQILTVRLCSSEDSFIAIP